MTMTQPALFDPEPVALFVLWCRQSPRHKWRALGSADTGSAALALMDKAGIKNGDWMLIEGKKNPNERNP